MSQREARRDHDVSRPAASAPRHAPLPGRGESSIRHLEATNLARHESFADVPTRPGFVAAFERAEGWSDRDEEGATATVVRPLTAQAPTAPPAARESPRPGPPGVRILDATNIARRENFTAPAGTAAPAPDGYETAD